MTFFIPNRHIIPERMIKFEPKLPKVKPLIAAAGGCPPPGSNGPSNFNSGFEGILEKMDARNLDNSFKAQKEFLAKNLNNNFKTIA